MLDIPTIKEKIKNDYWMMTFTIMTIIYFLFASFIFIMVPDEIYIAILVLGFGVFSSIALIARNNIVNRYFSNGMVVTATIVKIRRFSRYPFFIVSYNINNEEFQKKIYTSSSKGKNYNEDSRIRIIVDQDNHKKAIILSFYED